MTGVKKCTFALAINKRHGGRRIFSGIGDSDKESDSSEERSALNNVGELPDFADLDVGDAEAAVPAKKMKRTLSV